MTLLEEVPPEQTASVLDNLPGFDGGMCQVVETGCTTCYNARQRTINTTATAKVNRHFLSMARALDPRCWAECSDVFLQTHTVEPDGTGGYQPVDIGVPKGKSWSGLLRERVYAGGLIYENVLNIDFSVSVFEVRVNYALHAALAPLNGGLEIDDGYAVAAQLQGQPGWSELRMTKTVWFDDLTSTGGPWDLGELSNWFAPAVLCMWLHDATQNGPCCNPA
jgi:hypothetical protein